MTANDYEKYAAAGELFGRLRDCLGFGDLAMFSKSPGVITYQWTFNGRSGLYCQESSVTFEVLAAYSSRSLAFNISEQWKQKAKGECK